MHRADLTVLQRSEHIAEWIKLTEDKPAQLAPVSDRGRVEGRGNKGGINAAVRELGVDRTEAQRSVKIAALPDEAKEAAYEALHPETRNGGDRRSSDCQVGELKSERFTADTAKKTGQSERVIQRDAARGERIDHDVLTEIAGTKLDTGKTLDELASVPKVASRGFVR